jgi:hypothetical protein
MIRGWQLVVLHLCLVLPVGNVAAQQKPGGITVTQGNCNVSVLNTGSGSQTVQIPSAVCSDEADPARALRIRYVWLDSTSTSLLLAGNIVGNLAKLVGNKPYVLKTKVYDELSLLLNRFGSYLDDSGPRQISSYLQSSTNSSSGDQSEEHFRKSLGHLKLYNGEETITFPDIDAYLAVQNTNQFAPNYSMSYTNEVASDESPVDLLSTVILWRAVTADDLENYAGNITRLRNLVAKKSLGIAAGILPTGAPRIIASQQRVALENITVSAMRYFARAGWPADFLFLYTSGNVCVPERSGLIYLWPRTLFVQVAVLENVQGKVMPISAVRGSQIDSDRLRFPDDDKDWTPFELTFPIGMLQSNETVVVPLQIELRPSDMLSDPPTEAERLKYWEQIKRYPKPIVLKDEKGRILFKKTLDAFKKPTPAPLLTPYTYGPRVRLSAAVAEGKEIKLRQFDPSQITMQFGSQEGSCPRMLFQETPDGGPTSYGRVLVGASGSDRVQTDIRWHEGPALFLELAEDEPEITHIQSIKTYVVDIAGNERLVDAMTDRFIFPGAPLKIEHPVMQDAKRIRIEVRGYYESLPRLLLNGGIASTEEK